VNLLPKGHRLKPAPPGAAISRGAEFMQNFCESVND
jgi:hypothetical protein